MRMVSLCLNTITTYVFKSSNLVRYINKTGMFYTDSGNGKMNMDVGNEVEVDSEDEEEYHQADDDCIADDEAEQYVMPDISQINQNANKSIELEVVQLNSKGKVAGKKGTAPNLILIFFKHNR